MLTISRTRGNSLAISPPFCCVGGLKIREVKRDRMQRAFGGTSQTVKTVNIQIDPGQAREGKTLGSHASHEWEVKAKGKIDSAILISFGDTVLSCME